MLPGYKADEDATKVDTGKMGSVLETNDLQYCLYNCRGSVIRRLMQHKAIMNQRQENRSVR
jgi:uncharacterized protein YutD